MTKRKRSEEIPIRSQAFPESIYAVQSSEEGTVVGQPGLVERVATSGSPTTAAATDQVEGVQSPDAAAKALLASSPFWALLMEAGYTWWWTG